MMRDLFRCRHSKLHALRPFERSRRARHLAAMDIGAAFALQGFRPVSNRGHIGSFYQILGLIGEIRHMSGYCFIEAARCNGDFIDGSS
jgi:hypothetical protein